MTTTLWITLARGIAPVVLNPLSPARTEIQKERKNLPTWANLLQYQHQRGIDDAIPHADNNHDNTETRQTVADQNTEMKDIVASANRRLTWMRGLQESGNLPPGLARFGLSRRRKNCASYGPKRSIFIISTWMGIVTHLQGTKPSRGSATNWAFHVSVLQEIPCLHFPYDFCCL